MLNSFSHFLDFSIFKKQLCLRKMLPLLPLLLLTMGTVLVTLLLMLSVTLLPTVFVSLTPLRVVILFLLAKEMVTCHHQVLQVSASSALC